MWETGTYKKRLPIYGLWASMILKLTGAVKKNAKILEKERRRWEKGLVDTASGVRPVSVGKKAGEEPCAVSSRFSAVPKDHWFQVKWWCLPPPQSITLLINIASSFLGSSIPVH